MSCRAAHPAGAALLPTVPAPRRKLRPRPYWPPYPYLLLLLIACQHPFPAGCRIPARQGKGGGEGPRAPQRRHTVGEDMVPKHRRDRVSARHAAWEQGAAFGRGRGRVAGNEGILVQVNELTGKSNRLVVLGNIFIFQWYFMDRTFSILFYRNLHLSNDTIKPIFLCIKYSFIYPAHEPTACPPCALVCSDKLNGKISISALQFRVAQPPRDPRCNSHLSFYII